MSDDIRPQRGGRARAIAAATAAALVLGGLGVAGAVTADEPERTDVEESTDTSVEVEETTDTSADEDTTTTSTDTSEPPTSDAGEELEGATEEVEALEAPEDGQGPPEDTFGAWVSAQARQGGVDGAVVSAEARARAEARRQARTEDGIGEGTEAEVEHQGPPAHAGPPAGKGPKR